MGRAAQQQTRMPPFAWGMSATALSEKHFGICRLAYAFFPFEDTENNSSTSSRFQAVGTSLQTLLEDSSLAKFAPNRPTRLRWDGLRHIFRSKRSQRK